MKKAQAAVEYLITVGFAVMIIVVAFGLLMVVSSRSKDQIERNRVDELGLKLVENINAVYFQGEDSRITLQVQLPDLLSNIHADCYTTDKTVTSDLTDCVNSELIFTYKDGGERVFLIESVPVDTVLLANITGIVDLQVVTANKDGVDYVLIKDAMIGVTRSRCERADVDESCDLVDSTEAGFADDCCDDYGYCC